MLRTWTNRTRRRFWSWSRIFHEPGETKDKAGIKRVEGGPLFKKVRDVGQVLKFSMGARGKREKLESWVRNQFKKRNKRIDPAALELLIEKAGGVLRDLDDAIERVTLFTGGQERHRRRSDRTGGRAGRRAGNIRICRFGGGPQARPVSLPVQQAPEAG